MLLVFLGKIVLEPHFLDFINTILDMQFDYMCESLNCTSSGRFSSRIYAQLFVPSIPSHVFFLSGDLELQQTRTDRLHWILHDFGGRKRKKGRMRSRITLDVARISLKHCSEITIAIEEKGERKKAELKKKLLQEVIKTRQACRWINLGKKKRAGNGSFVEPGTFLIPAANSIQNCVMSFNTHGCCSFCGTVFFLAYLK